MTWAELRPAFAKRRYPCAERASAHGLIARNNQVGFPENTADVRIAQYETNARMPREELLKKLAQALGVQKEILTVPVLTKPKEFSAAFFWMTEMGEDRFHL